MQDPIVFSLVDDHNQNFCGIVMFTRSTPPLQMGW